RLFTDRDRVVIVSDEQPRHHPIELFFVELPWRSKCLRFADVHVACSTAFPDAPGRGRLRLRSASLSGGPAPLSPHELCADRKAAGWPQRPDADAQRPGVMSWLVTAVVTVLPAPPARPLPAQPSRARSPEARSWPPPQRPTPPRTPCGTGLPSA